MSKKDISILINAIHTEVNKKEVTKKAIKLYIVCSLIGDFSEVHQTTLYNKYGGSYCYMIEVIHKYIKDIREGLKKGLGVA